MSHTLNEGADQGIRRHRALKKNSQCGHLAFYRGQRQALVHPRLEESQHSRHRVRARGEPPGLTPGEISLPGTVIDFTRGGISSLHKGRNDLRGETPVPQDLGLNSQAVKASDCKAGWKIGP